MISKLDKNVFAFISTILTVNVVSCVATNESRLLSQIFIDYDTRARPVIDPTEQVQVDISLYLRSVRELNTKQEILSVVGWVFASWPDRRLAWNSSEYGGIDYVALIPTQLWMPTFVLGNSALSSLYVEEWYKYFKAKVFSDGTVTWAPGGIFTIECTIDVTYFPFDDQICVFKFENWIYTGDKVNLSFPSASEANMLANYIENGQWDVLDVKVMRHDVYYTLPIPYPEVVFGIHFRRKILFYVTNIILLSILIGILVLHIFKLPAESGEKISMGVTLLLAYSVFILMVNESIPETSTAVPVIIIYLVCIMAVTTLSICESVLVLYCYFHSGKHRAPVWLRFVIFNGISRCFCKDKITSKVQHISLMPEKQQSEKEGENEKPKEKNMANDNNFFKAVESDMERTFEQNQEEWQDIARLIDRFSFWFFVGIFLFLILVLLVIIPLSEPEMNIHKNTVAWAGF